MRLRNRLAIAVLGPVLTLGVVVFPSGSVDAAGAAPGVTSNSITIGVTYVDLSSVAQFVHGLDQGNYQAVYQALINHINAQGGINGRTLKADYEPINPIGTTSASNACAQLTEDDSVFAVMGFLQNNDAQCYLQLHTTPAIGGNVTSQILASAKAPWFGTQPLENQVEPEVIAAAAKEGVFKGKKVAVFSQSDAPPGLVSADVKALEAHGITPVATAQINGETNDVEAGIQQIAGVVTQKFQSAGANVVIAVGNTGQSWPSATNSGTYHPEMVAPYDAALTSYTSTAQANAPAIANAVTGFTEPLSVGNKAVGWSDPALQQCVHVVEAAGQKVPSPVNNTDSAKQQFFSVVQACQNLALFTAIIKKAGKTLNAQTFTQAGDTLGAVHVPALGTGSFSKATPAGTFPLYLYRWNASEGQLVPGSKPVGTT